MTSYRLVLILAGAVAVALIAVAGVMKHQAIVPAPLFGGMLLVAYGVGLGLGRLVWKRGG